MSKPFDPADWYWFVGGDETRAYASGRQAFVSRDDAGFRAWSADAVPSRIASEAELRDVLAGYGRTLLPGDPLPPAPRDFAAEIDDLKAKLARAEAAEAVLAEKNIITKGEIEAKLPAREAGAIKG